MIWIFVLSILQVQYILIDNASASDRHNIFQIFPIWVDYLDAIFLERCITEKAVIPVCILYVQYVTNFINVGLQLNQEKFSNKTRTLMETRLIVIYMYILLYKILYTYNDFSDKGIGFIAIFLYTSNGDLTLTIHIFPFYCCHCQYSYAF